MKKPIIFTIGHSTHSIDKFITLLKTYNVQTVVDIRTILKSRHNPQFNKTNLELALKQESISYEFIENLGGLRHTNKNSVNLGWRNRSFRGYADYMATVEFEVGLKSLIKIANDKVSVIMCAEVLPWRCHRSLVSDALIKQGWLVRDIMSLTKASRHTLTSFLKVNNGQITYPEPKS